MLHVIRASAAIRTFLHRSMSESARNCCTALNLHKAIALPKSPHGLVQIAVSTALPIGNAVTALLRTRSTVDTALEICRLPIEGQGR
jgi:hypothetical protein